MYDFIVSHWLDILTTVLGLIYIWLEYRAHIALWVVSVIMPALDIYLYWSHGLYGDAGMAAYYTLASIYGFALWKYKQHKARLYADGIAEAHSEQGGERAVGFHGSSPGEYSITHFRRRHILSSVAFFFVSWAAVYFLLVEVINTREEYVNSLWPVADAFTNALSFVALWALARKYVEQWLIWIVVDVVTAVMYVGKDIPFKASLYALYVIIAVFGYRKWRSMMAEH
ncbi:nicotinamide mononucleotide transporter family protein [Prevotella sp. OH937_COT-195]|uniref:nicotinamide mononucleotide transporter family protein n=1 Tax=Prevotella sp. OH937_COT-195 TaxID=2491051 RepID=UPI000F648770|nr:nicotinamide mononucleotide transporter family protein [Prevotella sp. OH937_COT-195]RRC99820.1 nicotinamide riboside transporter PnuC [Prevotella sp. OH937_COT-195]